MGALRDLGVEILRFKVYRGERDFGGVVGWSARRPLAIKDEIHYFSKVVQFY